MSVFSNPAGRAPAAATRYVESLLALLGDRDPIAVQRELVPALRRLLDGLDDAALRRPEASGKWSIAQVVEHLTDQEIVNAFRIRSTVAEDEPELRGYDQDRWASRLRYGAAPFAEVLDELEAVRRRNLRLYAALTPEEMQRFGRHAERGAERVDHLLRLTAGHDLVHRRQIERIRERLLT